jgi:hypothetical protein
MTMLAGQKTYILAALYALVAAYNAITGEAGVTPETIAQALEAGMIAALRAGIAKTQG